MLTIFFPPSNLTASHFVFFITCDAFWYATNLYLEVEKILKNVLTKSKSKVIIDLCSGGGGPSPMVH